MTPSPKGILALHTMDAGDPAAAIHARQPASRTSRRNSIERPPARLHLARALVLAGDTTRAKGVYADLLTLWKDADPTIRVVGEARAESARLR